MTAIHSKPRFGWPRGLACASALATLLLVSPLWSSDAHACQRWAFAVSQEEEGPTPNAGACARDDGGQTHLDIRCSGRDINIRYTPRVDGDFSNQQRVFVFETEVSSVRLDMAYEGMDGAFTAYLGSRHRIFEMLMSGDGLNVYLDRQRGVPERRFGLSGSRAAISRVLRACRT